MPRSRRALLAAFGSGLVASGAGCTGTDGGTTTTATSTTSTTSTRTTTRANPGEPRWTLETGTEPAGLVVRGGRVYFGSDAVYALDTDGTERWRYTAARQVRSLVVAGRVYATTGAFGAPTGRDFALHALDDGNELWSFARDDAGTLSRPAVGSERVFVATRDDYLERDGETLYGLSMGGDRLWSTAVGDPDLAFAAGTLFASYPRHFTAFDPGGTEQWSKSIQENYASFVGVRGDLAFASWQGSLRALGLAGGAERWTKAASGGTLAGDTLYTVTGDGTVLALDPATGAVQWRQSAPDPAPLTVVDGVVYVGGQTVTALAADDGTVRWRHEFEREPFEVTVGAGVVAVPVAGELHALDVTSGERRWTFTPPGDDPFKPHAVAVDAETVFFATNDGTLYALAV